MDSISSTANSSQPDERYTTVAIAIHWLAAVLIVSTLILGVSMVDLPVSPQRLKLYSYHKWIGILILVLSALRLGWRLTHRPPPNPDAVAWRRAAASLTHGALYLLFFAIPLVAGPSRPHPDSRWWSSAFFRCRTSCRWTRPWWNYSSPGIGVSHSLSVAW